MGHRRAKDNKCECGIAQNTVHLLRCPLEGRVTEEVGRDPEWCREGALVIFPSSVRFVGRERGSWGQRPASGLDNLPVARQSR